ncbi:MAG: hypothetical protein IJI58_04500 [Bacilli bacterium]|nr:hypothetical protein [Bacilli bacterium]
MKYLLIAIIVGVIIKVIRDKQNTSNKKIKDINNFTIYAIKDYVIILDIATIFFFALAVFAINPSDESQKFIWIAFVLWGFLSLLGSLAIRKKIVFKNDTITVKKVLLPSFKKYSIKDITRVEKSEQFFKVYSNDKCIFTCDNDLIGYDAALKRFETEGIKITGYKGRLLTKKSMLHSQILLFTSLLFFVLVFCFEIPLILQEPTFKTVLDSLLVGVVIIGIPMGLLYLWFVPRGYFQISKIEKALNIDFDDEMKKLDVTDKQFINNDWFIDIPARMITYPIIYHKKYIKSLDEFKKEEDREDYTTMIETIDGVQKIHFYSYSSRCQFEDWFKGISSKKH